MSPTDVTPNQCPRGAQGYGCDYSIGGGRQCGYCTRPAPDMVGFCNPAEGHNWRHHAVFTDWNYCVACEANEAPHEDEPTQPEKPLTGPACTGCKRPNMHCERDPKFWTCWWCSREEPREASSAKNLVAGAHNTTQMWGPWTILTGRIRP